MPTDADIAIFPLSYGVPRVDDRRVARGIIYVIKHELQWKDATKAYGPHKTLHNRFVRWRLLGVFKRVFTTLARGAKTERIMINAMHLKAHRTAASLAQEVAFPGVWDGQKGGLNSKLHAVCGEDGRAVPLYLAEGQVSDHKWASGQLTICPMPLHSSPVEAMAATASVTS